MEEDFYRKYVAIEPTNLITFDWPHPMEIGEVVPVDLGTDALASLGTSKKYTRARVVKCEYDEEIKMYKITFELGDPLSFLPSRRIISSRGK